MDIVLIVVAFAFGLLAARVHLPPLVGYLVAGFVLHAFGFAPTTAIETLSDVGVYLLLFGIGLKLKVGFLARPAVWGTATIQMIVFSALAASVVLAVGVLGLPLASRLDTGQVLILGLAFSFSSTVLAVKLLDTMNESGSLAGRAAVGVLIIQDVFAVGFLVITSDTSPTLWAIPMVLLIVALRPTFGWLVAHSGHGELLVLLGFVLAVGIGAGGFDAVGLKPELGALLAGLAVSTHPRAGEMADRLLDFKDLFLIGFFLSIGLAGTPPLGAYLVAAVMLLLIPIKGALFFALFARFRLRTRTAFHSSMTLSTYSEFGLIVASAGLAAGYLDQDWVTTVAVAVAGSFVLASIGNTARYRLYGALSGRLGILERQPPLPEDAVLDCGYAVVLVLGMGRVGVGAYDEIALRRGAVVVGIDRSEETVAINIGEGRNAIRGDALDRDLWERLRFRTEVELILIATDSHTSNLECVARAKEYLPDAQIGVIAKYLDQVVELNDAGVGVARNLYEEAGQGLADDAIATVWGTESSGDDGESAQA